MPPVSDPIDLDLVDDWLDRALVLDFADPIARPPKPIIDPTERSKRCRQCARRKPVSGSAKRRKSRDGYAHRCMQCISLLPD